jgi:plasmid stabilization system protein ParE
VSGRTYRLTVLADADIEDILTHTLREFGDRQLELYSALIDKAARMIGDEPMRASAKPRHEAGPAVRSFHIEIAAERQGAASHVPYYVPGKLADGTEGAIVLRVLWEDMDPRPLVARGLNEL